LAQAKEIKEKISVCEGTCAIPWYIIFSIPRTVEYPRYYGCGLIGTSLTINTSVKSERLAPISANFVNDFAQPLIIFTAWTRWKNIFAGMFIFEIIALRCSNCPSDPAKSTDVRPSALPLAYAK
jgi:hypothetical protein